MKKLSVNHGSILYRQFSCAMLANIDQDNIADYFPVQSCSWTVGQHCTCHFLVQCWHRQIKTTLYRLISCEKCSVCSGPTLYKSFFYEMFSQTCLDNIA